MVNIWLLSQQSFGYLFTGVKNLGTIGGAISTNFSGSRRFKVGSARDHVLGIKVVNGRGEIVKSGGTVVKNVTTGMIFQK